MGETLLVAASGYVTIGCVVAALQWRENACLLGEVHSPGLALAALVLTWPAWVIPWGD